MLLLTVRHIIDCDTHIINILTVFLNPLVNFPRKNFFLLNLFLELLCHPLALLFHMVKFSQNS